MKQKAKIYKGRRIVIGDKNLITKNEIHVNDIPQEGGESGGGESGGELTNWLYVSAANIDKNTGLYIIMYAQAVKAATSDGSIVEGPAAVLESAPSITYLGFAFAVDLPIRVNGQSTTVGSALTLLEQQMGLTLIPITKEEYIALG